MLNTIEFARLLQGSALSAALIAAAPFANAADNAPAAKTGADARETQLRAAIQRDLGIPAAKVDAVFSAQIDGARRADRARQSLDRNAYGGSWLVRRADGGFDAIVGIADGRTHTFDGAIQRKVQYSFDALQSQKAKLDAFRQTHGSQKKWQLIQSWYVDVQQNRVVVETVPNASLQVAYDFLASARVPGGMVQVRRASAVATQAATPATIKRGYAIFSGGARCSIGIPVIQTGAGLSGRGYVTAAHCAGSGATVTIGQSTGKVKQINVSTDLELVIQDTDDDLLDNENMWPSYAASDAPVGSFVCKSGSSTGVSCGVVRAQGVTTTYKNTPYPIYNLTSASFTSQPGDSGGGVAYSRYPVGVVSGFEPATISTPAISYYAPMKNTLVAFGVRHAKTYSATLDPTKTAINDKTTTEATTAVASRDEWPSNVHVNVNISHPSVGDLVLTLYAPSGKSYPLYNQTSSASPDLKKTFNTAITPENPNGDWKLKIEDRKAGNDGILTRFTITL